MRIYNENTENYIRTLASSISKDPASLENWRCLHIASVENAPIELQEITLNNLRETHKDMDCDVVHCADGDILFVSRDLQTEQLYFLAEDLVNIANNQWKCGEITLYDLFADWREIWKILGAKVHEQPTIKEPLPTAHDFGEIASLNEVFSAAKNLRKSRMPLHIMLVEDDPMTRRVVTGGFKESYALITAENANEAVANYLMYAPDIVFLDIGLPDTSGFDVLRQIMASDPDAYVVMFSANSYLDNITTALNAGAAGFIAKPFKKEKMRKYIQDSAAHHQKTA
jgi:CheY-like chemotaxis protein